MPAWASIRGRLIRKLLPPSVAVIESGPVVLAIAKAAKRAPRLDRNTSAALDVVAADVRQMIDPEPIYGTVAAHFAASSSSRSRLALLAHLVRLVDAASILEIGTAYGMSAIAMGKAQRRPALVTMDLSEPQISISRRHLAAAFPTGGVEQIAGDKSEIIPRLVQEGRKFDFVFHDGGHDGDAYVRDFASILPCLQGDSLFLIDDIEWDRTPSVRARTSRSKRTCYEGWREVAQHDRVGGAIEINKQLGIIVVRQP